MLAFGRSFPHVSEFVQSLGKASEIWLNPNHPLRQETVQALQVSTGFSRRQIEMALANCFEELSFDKLKEFLGCHSGGRKPESIMIDPGFRRGDVLHILPSNVFTAWVHGAVITLLLGHRCLLKPSAREPVFAIAWRKSLMKVDSQLADRVEIVAWDPKNLQKGQAVVAYGSDETLETIRSLLPEHARFAGYGHKLSVAIVFWEALIRESSESLLDEIRMDADPFRLQGCLSPQILYVENQQMPRWPELEATLDVVPKIRPFAQWDEVYRELGKFTPYLSCVGYAGSPERATYLTEALRSYSISRICPIGQMQRPPLTWQNGGINLANLLNSSSKGG